MDKEETLRELIKLNDIADYQEAHQRADEILLKYINDEDVEVLFREIVRIYR